MLPLTACRQRRSRACAHRFPPRAAGAAHGRARRPRLPRRRRSRRAGEPVPLDRQWIEQHIPHKGRMCLLDEVLAWDARRIRCRSATHRATDNPLRSHGRLGAACGIEYAAQAMAVHGALVAASAPLERTVSSNARASIGPAIGYLASVRNVVLCVERLDDIEADLIA